MSFLYHLTVFSIDQNEDMFRSNVLRKRRPPIHESYIEEIVSVETGESDMILTDSPERVVSKPASVPSLDFGFLETFRTHHNSSAQKLTPIKQDIK